MSVSIKAINSNNFIRLNKIVDGTYQKALYYADGLPPVQNNVGGAKVNTFSSLYEDQKSCPVYMVQGEEFTFYANLDTLEDNVYFIEWIVNLIRVTPDGQRIIDAELGEAPLSKVIVSGTDYRFSCSFTVPELQDGGSYEIAIINNFNDDLLYVSQLVSYRANVNKEGLQLIRYRNPVNIFNYDYVSLGESFYNRIYLETFFRPIGQRTNTIGYDLVSGAFKPVRTTTGRDVEFITQAYKIDDHEAFNAMTVHGDIQFAYLSNWKSLVRSQDSSYVFEFPNTRDQLADGSITLEMTDNFTSNKIV